MIRATYRLFRQLSVFTRTTLTGAVLAMSNGPWGSRPDSNGPADGPGNGENGGDKDPDKGDREGPRNPWTQGGGQRPGGDGDRPSMVDDLLRRGRQRLGGVGSGFGGGWNSGGFGRTPDGRPLWPVALGILLLIWVAMTSVHRIGPQERGVVMRLGSYARTMTPGINLSLPSPFESVDVIDVEKIETIDIGSTSANNANLMLTRDQNLVDLAYSVRWNIRNPELFLLQLPEDARENTIREVAESAMRAAIAGVSLNDAMGAGRDMIEDQVATSLQAILDRYHTGVRIQGVAIKQADPPDEVNDAFKSVTAAQQSAQTNINQANAYAQRVLALAQGEATAFDKVYTQYSLSPEVTRRRMYYETMEAILPSLDKTIVEPGSVTPYLPLPELRKRAAAAPEPNIVVEGK